MKPLVSQTQISAGNGACDAVLFKCNVDCVHDKVERQMVIRHAEATHAQCSLQGNLGVVRGHVPLQVPHAQDR
jgi:hypothetical protein